MLGGQTVAAEWLRERRADAGKAGPSSGDALRVRLATVDLPDHRCKSINGSVFLQGVGNPFDHRRRAENCAHLPSWQPGAGGGQFKRRALFSDPQTLPLVSGPRRRGCCLESLCVVTVQRAPQPGRWPLGAAWGRLPGCALQHRCDLGLPGRNRGNVVDAQWAACSCQHPGVRSPSRDPNDSVPHPCVTPPNSTPYHGRSGGRDHRAQCGLFR